MEASSAFARVDAAFSSLRGEALEDALKGIAAECASENGERSPLYAALCSELGGYYRGRARYAESEAEFLKAADIIHETRGGESPDYTTVLNNLAGTYRLMREYGKAESLFARCIENYEKTLGTHHVLYAAGLNNYALVCLDEGDLTRAEEYLGRSAEVLAGLPECVAEYASALSNQSALLLRLGRPADAVPLLETVVELFSSRLSRDTAHYHAALNSLGIARMALGDDDAAAESFAAALRAAEDWYGADNPETREVRRNLEEAERRRREHI